MKFKDKDGNVFDHIHTVTLNYCKEKSCITCALYAIFDGTQVLCYEWANDFPAEAARLMGYEVVKDEPYNSVGTCGICEKFVPTGYSGFGRCAITDEEHRSEDKCNQKEADMDKQNSNTNQHKANMDNVLANATPRICEMLGVNPGEMFRITGFGDVKFWILGDGTFSTIPSNAPGTTREFLKLLDHPDRIIRHPRFTEEEVADARVLAKALLAERFERNRYEDIYSIAVDGARTLLDSSMFPSIRPGQSVKLSEIVGGEP